MSVDFSCLVKLPYDVLLAFNEPIIFQVRVVEYNLRWARQAKWYGMKVQRFVMLTFEE